MHHHRRDHLHHRRLADGTTYTITVVAHTTVGDSGASPPATVTIAP